MERYLFRHHKKWESDHINMVAQTIFPFFLLPSSCTKPEIPEQRQAFYDKYMKNSPIIRAFKGNSRGTYFQRLIWWPHWDTPRGQRINQIENIIAKISSGRATRVVHEMALEVDSPETITEARLYNPSRDRKHTRMMGFPCLSHLSIKPESAEKAGGKIHMAALYRNHYFIERAYGNYLGLGRLLKFIADATNREVGELLCVSSLARLDGLSKTELARMLALLRNGGAE